MTSVLRIGEGFTEAPGQVLLVALCCPQLNPLLHVHLRIDEVGEGEVDALLLHAWLTLLPGPVLPLGHVLSLPDRSSLVDHDTILLPDPLSGHRYVHHYWNTVWNLLANPLCGHLAASLCRSLARIQVSEACSFPNLLADIRPAPLTATT